MIHLIVPVLNAPAYTQACLASIREQKNVNPIIVNNGSRKRTSDLITEWTATGGKQVILPMNKGFAGAVNAGLRSLGDALKDNTLILIMHNDTIPFDGCIEEMVAVLQASDDDVAAVLPRTSCCMENSFCIPEIRGKFIAIKPSNKERVTFEDVNQLVDSVIPDRKTFLADLAKSARLQSTYSPEISSFCMLTRGLFFREYGLWDEDFWPRYWEDKQWWRPIERDGYVAVVANRAFCWHFQGITADGPGFCLPEIFVLNEERYKQKCLDQDRLMTQTIKERHPYITEANAENQ